MEVENHQPILEGPAFSISMRRKATSFPSCELHISTTTHGTFESMIFWTSRLGYVIVPWRVYIPNLLHAWINCEIFPPQIIITSVRGSWWYGRYLATCTSWGWGPKHTTKTHPGWVGVFLEGALTKKPRQPWQNKLIITFDSVGKDSKLLKLFFWKNGPKWLSKGNWCVLFVFSFKYLICGW